MRPATTTVRIAVALSSLLSVVAFAGCTDSNDPLGGDQASIGVDRNAVSFSVMATGALPASTTVAVTNVAGAGAVTGPTPGFIGSLDAKVTYASGSASGWLDAKLDRQSDPAVLTLSLKTTSVLPGTHRATVEVTGKLANKGTALASQSIAVTYDVATGPNIAVSGTTLDFETWAGGPDPIAKTLQVTNSGATGTTLEGLTASVGTAAWLRATPSTATAPATLTVSALSQGLVAGTYPGTVTLSSSVTAVTRTVGVTFTVTAGPKIGVAPSAAAFDAVVGTVPAAKTLTISNSAGGELTGLSARPITYGAGGTGWLNASLSGSVAPATLTLQPAQAAASLAAGQYTATVPIASTVPGVTDASISVTLTVASGPTIALDATSVSFQGDAGGVIPAVKDVMVTNGGGGTLNGLTVAGITYDGSATGWLSATLTTAQAPSTLHLQPSRTNLAAGNYAATVKIASSVAGVADKTVTVNYSLRDVAVIVVNPTSADFAAVSNSPLPAQQSIVVSNGGTGTLGTLSQKVAYQGAQSGWLTVTLTAGSNGGTLTLRPNTTTLPLGTVSATVTISSSQPGVTDALIPVRYEITPLVPIIQFDKPNLSISTELGILPGYGDQFGPVAISNATPNTTLNGLSASITYLQGAPGWLGITLNSTSAPTTVAIGRLNTSPNYAIGTYTANVTIASTVPGVAARSIGITWVVTPVPCIKFDPTSLTFTTTQFVDAAAQVVNVTNGCSSAVFGGLNILGDLIVTATLATTFTPTALTIRPHNTTPSPRPPGSYQGTVTMYVEAGACCRERDSKSLSYTINVLPGIGTVTVTPPNTTLAVGNSVQLSAAVQASPGLATTVTWLSNDSRIATVSATGLVTAVAKGTVLIIARSTVDNTRVGSASITVP